MQTRESNKKRYLRYAAVAFLLLFLLSLGLLLLDRWEKKNGVYDDTYADVLNETINYNGKEYVLKKNVETYLFLGLDKGAGSENSDGSVNDDQADFIMLVVVDNEKKTYTSVQLNRDTMVEMNILGIAGDKVGTVTQQLALAHTYGSGDKMSCRNTADAVSKLLLNVKIDNYISVTMEAVSAYNDMLGGVEVEVLDDFTNVDNTLVKGETVKLTGKQALTYVRSRYGIEDGSNENRMKRQRQYLSAVKDKTATVAEKDEEFILNALLSVADHMVMNCTVNKMERAYNKVSAYEDNGIRTLSGTFKQGEKFLEFYPDKTLTKELAIELFYEVKE